MATLLPRFAALFGPHCLFERWEDLADLMAAGSSHVDRDQVGLVVVGEAVASLEMIGAVAASVVAACSDVRARHLMDGTANEAVGRYVAVFALSAPTASGSLLELALDLYAMMSHNERWSLEGFLAVLGQHPKGLNRDQLAAFIEAVNHTRVNIPCPERDLLLAILEGICPTDD